MMEQISGGSGITASAGRRLLASATATGYGAVIPLDPDRATSVVGYGTTSAGAGAATVNVEVSNDGTYFVLAGTISLTLATTVTTTTNTDGFLIAAGWRYARANMTAISGTGAAVTVKS